MNTQIYTGMMVIEHCFKCGIPFGIEESKQRELNERGGSFYCTNGHGQIYVVSAVQKLQRELESKNNELRAAVNSKEYFRELSDKKERSLKAVKGHKTRILKRIHAGVCPHCSRNFENLSRHMDTKHKNREGEK